MIIIDGTFKRFSPFLVVVRNQWQANIVTKMLMHVYPDYEFQDHWFNFMKKSSQVHVVGYTDKPTYSFVEDHKEKPNYSFSQFTDLATKEGLVL